ncbi:cation-translocating P-type ATPase [Streptomyces sp. NPDC094448]|uniref:cation-translocating P-type ATPase n=1 Tax=Streptomyces sp. NPDC094448 TaxID=3366063 RepID=UPI00380A4B84
MTQSARIEPDEHGPDHDHDHGPSRPSRPSGRDGTGDRRPADHPAIDAGSELDPVHPVRPPAPAPAAGLSSAQVAERIARGEVNDVPVRSSRSTADIIRGNVFTRFNAIIGVLWAIMLIVAPIQDSLFGFVIIANTGIGIIQELRAKKTLDGLAVIGEAKPTVRRDGKPAEISTSEIVLGDLVELGPGDKVVVDGKVVEADSLEIDESLLTGEADPVLKRPGDPVMSGSFVVAGGGAFTATKVGREAYAAQLAEEASRFTLVHSELRSGISTILKYVTWMMVPTAIGLIISQLVVKNADLKDSIARTVGGIVPMIPEGLVLLTSVAFAIGVIRLGRKQCLVQELPAIEGLARVDVVCLDKTGTLTEGGMDVAEVRPLGGADPAYVARVLGAIGTADPRPNASQKAIAEAYPDAPGWRILDALPFSSARKYSGARFAEGPVGAEGAEGPGGPDGSGGSGGPDGSGGSGGPDGSGGPGSEGPSGPGGLSGPGGPGGADGPGSSGGADGSAWLLGAPDVLLTPGDPVLGEIDQLNEQGLRVLLLARAGSLEDPAGARATALVVLEQRLRPDASDTLAYFADQDVTAKVISGDNAVSVGAVAAKLGLPGAEHTVDARTLPTERNAMAEALESGAVFGRVSPQQKRDMVGALQSRGHTVAMTGDGVNDVLALKDADIGVSMGSGSEATRAVAQIVLLNNSFSTLPSVVAEGRRVIGNITRVATLFLTKTVYSVLLAILVVISQVEYPFLPRHLTLLATLTIGVPAFFLALAPNKERAQPHFVRRVMRYAIPSGIIAAAATFTTYLLARSYYSGTDALDAETSAATLTLFLVALWVLAIVARPYTWWRIALVATMGLGFLIVLVVPWLQEFFALRLVGTAMPWTAVGIAAAAGLLLEVAWRVVDRRVPA